MTGYMFRPPYFLRFLSFFQLLATDPAPLAGLASRLRLARVLLLDGAGVGADAGLLLLDAGPARAP